jgi:AraC-like DNA-binding protein/mannose-6-phosphate isomerase-like protein (cupin superfamily)
MHEGMVEVKKRESDFSEKQFPFEVVHVGEPASNMSTFHWHEFMEISFIRSGEGKYEIEDKVFHVEKGDIIVINNIEKHRVTYKPGNPLYETVIHFDSSLISSGVDGFWGTSYLDLFKYERTGFNNIPELDKATKEEVQSLVSGIEKEYFQKNQYYELSIKAKLLCLITVLLRNCNIKTINDFDVIAKRNQIERLEKILKYVNENYDKEINLALAAQKFYMNTSYFSDYFKKNVGINFTDYLAKVRINKAVKLLGETGISSTEIAFSCGFNNVTSFYNTFKKIKGMNPGDFKKNPAQKEMKGERT